MDRLLAMRAFCAVAELGKFRAAAMKLAMSPAMLSKHVAQLESALGARLLARNTRHVSLTDEGQSYFAEARKILDDLDNLDAAMSSKAQSVSGRIRLTAPIWMANGRFTDALARFLDQNPDVTFDIDLSGRQVNLIEEGFDLALRVSSQLDPNLIARAIGNIQFGLYASPQLLARFAPIGQVQDLTQLPFLVYGALLNPKEAFQNLFGHEIKGDFRPVIVSENETLLLQAACAGLGMVFLPDIAAAEARQSGALVPILPDKVRFVAKLHAVYSSRRLLPARVRQFLDHLYALPMSLST